MRIVQLIDSLDVGGAEKIAINFTNALHDKIDFSGIIATRKEGDLIHSIENRENYIFLNKKHALDYKSIFVLRNYCVKHKIEFIHAHGTSFFTAFLLKLFFLKVKILWHDHSGARSSQRLMQNKMLWFCSKLFYGIITVNNDLEFWCKEKLNFKNVIYLPNFTTFTTAEQKTTVLQGFDNKRILSLANLRNPKNHKLLIEVAIEIVKKHKDWTFHLIGKDYNDDYSNDLKEIIKGNNLENSIFLYGLKNDIKNIIEQAEICVFTSTSEGLPVALLEYGLLKKAVISTKVGEIQFIIKNNQNGLLVNSKDSTEFFNSLVKLIEHEELRIKFGNNLYKTIIENNSQDAIITTYLKWLKKDNGKS